jgi:nucleoside-diphosphate-sugar epimerase
MHRGDNRSPAPRGRSPLRSASALDMTSVMASSDNPVATTHARASAKPILRRTPSDPVRRPSLSAPPPSSLGSGNGQSASSPPPHADRHAHAEYDHTPTKDKHGPHLSGRRHSRFVGGCVMGLMGLVVYSSIADNGGLLALRGRDAGGGHGGGGSGAAPAAGANSGGARDYGVGVEMPVEDGLDNAHAPRTNMHGFADATQVHNRDCSRVALDHSASVLVTGAAGFIGSALARSLALPGPDGVPKVRDVVGLDNFNDYYSPALKRARAARTQADSGVVVVDGDVCDGDLLTALFDTHNFTHVVHLAAQAGVRYSIKHPQSYVRNNVECFVTLAEVVRRRTNDVQFVYASSSSVYGLNDDIPFAEHHSVDRPANLYGATKRMNENIAYSYHHLYGLHSIGLRFFTVYGPWGRPDMAAYLFTERISRGESITVYNGGHMRRDFTYIDDIVRGIEGSMAHCAEVSAPSVTETETETRAAAAFCFAPFFFAPSPHPPLPSPPPRWRKCSTSGTTSPWSS